MLYKYICKIYIKQNNIGIKITYLVFSTIVFFLLLLKYQFSDVHKPYSGSSILFFFDECG